MFATSKVLLGRKRPRLTPSMQARILGIPPERVTGYRVTMIQQSGDQAKPKLRLMKEIVCLFLSYEMF